MAATRSSSSSFSTLLSDVLPFTASKPSTIVIGDSLAADGRFVLYNLAHDILASGHRLLWLTATPSTDTALAMNLKKLGCDVATGYLRHGSTQRRLTIRSLTGEVAQHLEMGDTYQTFCGASLVQNWYRSIQEWLSQDNDDDELAWIILDDMSTLAHLLDETLVVSLVYSIQALASERNHVGLAIRVAVDIDQARIRAEERSSWLGAGGVAPPVPNCIPWERSLVELADYIVDVSPLASGPSRQAHGRLTVTTAGAGSAPVLANYCLTESKILAIRLVRGNK